MEKSSREHLDKVLANDRAANTRGADLWLDAEAVYKDLGPQPQDSYLAKRNQDLPHSLENSIWALTKYGKREQRKQEMRDLQSKHMPKP